MLHHIKYSLAKPYDRDIDYQRVNNRIGLLESAVEVDRGVWVIDAPLDAGDIGKFIWSALRPGDSLFVTQIGGQPPKWSSYGMSPDVLGWLQSRVNK